MIRRDLRRAAPPLARALALAAALAVAAPALAEEARAQEQAVAPDAPRDGAAPIAPLPAPAPVEPSAPAVAETPAPEPPPPVRTPARAPQAPRDGDGPLDRRTLALDASLGLGAPRGFVGAGLELLPMGLVSVHAGAGLAAGGPAVAAGARVRVLRRGDAALALGAGWSTNRHTQMAGELVYSSRKSPPTYFFERAHFMNVDLAGEAALFRSVVVRVLAGAGVVVNGRDAVWVNTSCTRAPCGAPPPLVVPYLALELATPVL